MLTAEELARIERAMKAAPSGSRWALRAMGVRSSIMLDDFVARTLVRMARDSLDLARIRREVAEECARVCDDLVRRQGTVGRQIAVADCAAAIRAKFAPRDPAAPAGWPLPVLESKEKDRG